MNTETKSHIPKPLVPLAFLFYLVVNIISWRYPFFWDTLLTSTITHWFLENGFNYGILPTAIDAGHPPLFYGYLLGWWKFFGDTLYISHLAMLPFLWVMVYQFMKIAAWVLQDKTLITFATILFCFETTILAQSTMVSYDILILAGYFYGLRYLLENRKDQVLIVGIVLSLVSLRGAFAFAALFITELLIFWNKRGFFKILLPYMPALLVFILWNIWHYKNTGWLLFAVSEQWANQRESIGISGMLKNVAVIIRNLIEPGRIILFGCIGIGMIYLRKKIRLPEYWSAFIFPIIPLLVFSLLFIPFSNPIGHRYLMIPIALSIIFFIQLIRNIKYRNVLIALTLAGFLSGHFWYQFYPENISKGWDSSLAHVPYFKAKKNMWSFMDAQNIAIDSVAAQFPVDVSMQQSRLLDDKRRPQKLDSVHTQYILTSTVNNEISPKNLMKIESEYSLLHQEKNREIVLNLYVRKTE